MKTRILYFALLTLFIVSCKKNQFEEPNSEWVIDGSSYKGFGASHPAGSSFAALESATRYGRSTGNYISINFGYGYMPRISGTYVVGKQARDTTQCSVTVHLEFGPRWANRL